MPSFDQERGTLLAAAAEQRERWGSYPVHDPAGKVVWAIVTETKEI
jgi:hypothetical protein